jgi:sulfatase maturation enzyme AslB (radical SAM superfamily)
MDYAYSKKKNVYFEMITNGIKFKDVDFIERVYNNRHTKEGRVSISISFDGWNGNVDRIYRGGKQSRDDVVEALSNLSYLKLPFRIRYTIHPKNINTIVKDLESIIENFKPLRIITSETNALFSNDDFIKIYQAYEVIRQKWNNNEITTPICEVVCDTCDGCSVVREGLKLFIGDETREKNGSIIGDGTFTMFDKYKKEDKK